MFFRHAASRAESLPHLPLPAKNESMPRYFLKPLIWCVTLLLFGMGLIGTLIPMLPGIIIIAAGCIWQGIMGSHSWRGGSGPCWRFWSREDSSLTRFPAAWEPKIWQYSAGIWGAIIGAIVGAILFPPLSAFWSCRFWVLLAELIFARKDIAAAFKAGSGAALGDAYGLLLEFHVRPADYRLVLLLLFPVLKPGRPLPSLSFKS